MIVSMEMPHSPIQLSHINLKSCFKFVRNINDICTWIEKVTTGEHMTFFLNPTCGSQGSKWGMFEVDYFQKNLH